MISDLPSRSVGPVSGDAMREWSDALRDANPIHLDRAAAAALGYGPRRVNPGPANLAYLIDLAMAAFPKEAIATIEAVFHGNVFEDDHLVAQGTLSQDGTITAALIRSDDNEPVVRARITLA